MKLELHERFVLLTLLPKEGDYAALKTIRRAKEMLNPTPQEVEAFEIVQTTGTDGKPVLNWNAQKASEAVKDCPVDEYTMNLIRDELAKLNKTKKLTEQYLSVYDKFVVAYK